MTPKTTKKRKASDAAAAAAGADVSATSTLQVHRCRFVDWMPSAIHALCFNATGDQLAVARATGDVEIWSVSSKWHLKAKFGAVLGPGSDRLFASSLDGTLWELDLQSLCRINVTDSNGGPIWSMVMDAETQHGCGLRGWPHPPLLVADGQLYFSKGFLTTGGRAHKIFSGGENGVIHCWNAATGRNESRITLETLTKQKSVVWSLVVLDDLTLVSGDSAGNLSFWNAPTGTLLQKFSHLTADILAICVSQSNNTLFASGVDNQVVEFRRSVAESGNATWAYSYSHRGHSHDVRALALSSNAKPVLVSGGIDTQLVWYRGNSFGASRPAKIASMPYRQSIALANEKRVLMVQKSTSLVSGALNLSCSALAPNASFVACSNSKELKLFELDTAQDFQPKKVSTLPLSVKGPARVLAFSPDSTRLVIASSSHQIRVLDLAKMEVLKTFEFYCQLPRPSEMHTSMSFNPSGKTLVVTLVSNSFVCYDVETKGLSEWYRRNLKGMTFDPANPDFLYLYSQVSLYQINMGKQASAKSPPKKTRRRAMSVGTESDSKNDAAEGELVELEDGFCRVVNRYRPLSFVDFVADNELIIVETPWLKVLSRLPGALHRHKYGK
ncbi:WD40-repeat-containing domain [Phytophthora cactorum]|nr:WD40-repeat-containing domain [Phytophthora cactorum]